ncbi:MAG: 7-cyano-7-deazaguanine synthase [Candidatus Omnitrophica bacterium]|nr:7-cyano-7-deazaguanine synthase [Candidatus Omnitrophota bacterium]MCF7892361.1 7-cyano-7-deazaguanine synthase [Candidatus Omnitrophota bacterium]MCF7895617.1 7-cyano-7-deazaguanine synthase [Candidatus Omnitrophota bacterium]MCF7897310.1 7-cyano-7-deazaguanine synthase [Candidatus Omnitrophota bacterium]MCF7909345.1 7-cyano-7-deazaguanine synthase [Candidatus Omnitrophota bacterium]
MRAVALLSGGLDSILAAKLIKEQGIEVAALHFDNHFSACSENQKEKLLNKISKQLGIKFENKILDESYLSIIKNPKYGFGKNLNPCIDCRIYILKKAKEYMEKIGASFVITGEVLGQRPMSQHRKALFNVERESGLEGLILRPLSAKLFPETIPEKKGWVKRNYLLSISGRSRKIQLELANKYKIKNYLWAGGGCLLTDAGFSRRLQDIIKKGQFNLDNIELLKVGRHFRFNPSFKFIVGRNEKENQQLEYLKKEDDYLFKPIEQSGPTGLGRGKINQSIKELCTKIITRYSSADQDFKISIMNGKEKINEIAKAEMPENNKYRLFII